MDLAITTREAAWFLPLLAPICFYVAYTDCKSMRITNQAVVLLFGIFVVVGFFILPTVDWAWRLLHMVAVLFFGILLNAGGALGAGDAKFAAAAAPFFVVSDLIFLMILLSATILAAFATHRLTKFTPLRRLAPDWESWQTGSDFPMGLALGPCLALYLLCGLLYGSTP
ncbi:MAG: prepilin peptidase [Marinovum sp.]|nr:prepilin peptidase [Marinovum sp.]